MGISVDRAHQCFSQLQEDIVRALEGLEGDRFERDPWERPAVGGGLARYREGGAVFERAGVLFSHTHGDSLPASATAQRPGLVGRSWEAVGVSMVLHPRNPYVPTTHMNVRLFVARRPNPPQEMFWFGGGLDLTPYYPFEEDVRHFHQVCHNAVAPFGHEIYTHCKRWCDEYFYLRHRSETRGVGGLFFDDLDGPDFETCFALTAAVGRCFLDAYVPIVQRRQATPYTEHERGFQAYRRSRYAEFNLVYDRGTLFGLQSGGRTESILLSMPPTADWHYRCLPRFEADEAALAPFLRPREWLTPTAQ